MKAKETGKEELRASIRIVDSIPEDAIEAPFDARISKFSKEIDALLTGRVIEIDRPTAPKLLFRALSIAIARFAKKRKYKVIKKYLGSKVYISLDKG